MAVRRWSWRSPGRRRAERAHGASVLRDGLSRRTPLLPRAASSTAASTLGEVIAFTRADGESVQSDATVVSKALWNTLEERGPIEIRYLPEWPYHYLAPGEAVKDKLVLVVVFLALGAVLSAGVVVVLARLVRRKREIARLRQDGLLAKATVSDARQTGMRVRGEWQIEVRLSYRDAGGREHRGGVTLSPAEARPWGAGRTAYVHRASERQARLAHGLSGQLPFCHRAVQDDRAPPGGPGRDLGAARSRRALRGVLPAA